MSAPFHAKLRAVAEELDRTSRAATDKGGTSAGEGVRLVFDVLLKQLSCDLLGVPLPADLRLSDGRLSAQCSADVTGAVVQAFGGLPGIDELGALYDAMGGIPSDAAPRSARRKAGRFLTPPALARQVARSALAETGGLRRSYVDPAAGAGSMLVQVLREADLDRRRDGALLLHGVDRDPIAVALARALVWLECGDSTWDGAELHTQIRVGDAIASALEDWHAWFPAQWEGVDGFGAVVTNPPWNRVHPRKSEFRAAWQGDPEELEAAWVAHQADQRAYAERLRQHADYSAQGGGDGDLYKYFMERIPRVLRSDGVASLLIPSGFLRSAGASELRRQYLDHGQFRVLVEFTNKKRIFPIHGMFRFLLAVYAKGGGNDVRHYQVGCLNPDDLDGTGAPVELTKAFLATVSGPDVGVPEVRSQADLDLLARLHSSYPRLGDPQGGWKLRFRRELDMTLDRDKFVHVSEAEQRGFGPALDGRWVAPGMEALLPVYEGRMVNQFEAAAKGYVRGTGRRAVWNGRPSGSPRPQYLVPEGAGRKMLNGAEHRAGFCDVSGHANKRTVLAALIPPNVVCGNKVPTTRFEPADLRLDLMWLAIVNSFTFDWIVRRWVSTTLNFFYWWNFPFPRLVPGDPSFDRLAAASASLSGVTVRGTGRQGLSLDDPWRRAQHRADIEAVVAQLYGLSIDEYAHVLDDFPLVDRNQPAAEGSSSRLTRDLSLLTYVASTGRDDLAMRERIDAARRIGAVPFQP